MTTPNPSLVSPIKVALIGYGNAGRIFHAPLVSGVPGFQLSTIVSSRAHDVLADWPHVKVVPTPEMAFADPSIDLVVVATGNDSHYPLASAALLAGKHVVVDKPCAVSLQEAEDLLRIAKEQGRVLTVFQNRRWDADFLSLREVIESGVLGRVVHFESHFDRYRPVVPHRWREQDLPGSGLWFDLGAHLVDQCLQLFGAPDDLMVDMACQREDAIVNDYFHAQLRYPTRHPGLRVLLHAGVLVPELGPRFVVHGTLGSFVKYGLDVQEDALKAGARPQLGATEHWGCDPLVGRLTVYEDGMPVQKPAPDQAGNYLAYYAQLRDYLQGAVAAPDVTPEQVYQDMQMLSLGEISAREGRFVAIQ
jgi:predicted dehydrogenase